MEFNLKNSKLFCYFVYTISPNIVLVIFDYFDTNLFKVQLKHIALYLNLSLNITKRVNCLLRIICHNPSHYTNICKPNENRVHLLCFYLNANFL